MTIAVSGATGHLGRLVVDELLARGTAPGDIVAVVRDAAHATDLAERGVQVRLGDYDRPDTLGPALAGVDTLLLVSGNEVGRRVAQHRAVVDAAVSAGVQRLAYTSIVRADTTPLLLAAEHRETEELVRASGLPYTLLRNSWYLENYTSQVPTYLRQGTIVGSADGGRVSGATRRDFAAAAAAVLVDGAHDGRSTSSAATRPSRWPSWPPRCPGAPTATSTTGICRSTSTPRCSPLRGSPSRWRLCSPTPTPGSRAVTCSWTPATSRA